MSYEFKNWKKIVEEKDEEIRRLREQIEGKKDDGREKNVHEESDR